MPTTQYSSYNSAMLEFNELRSIKDTIRMNSFTYRPRLKKSYDPNFVSGPKVRKLRQTQSRIRAKIHSWSMVHCVFKIRESAQVTPKIHNPCTFIGKSVDPKTYSAPPHPPPSSLLYLSRFSIPQFSCLIQEAGMFKNRKLPESLTTSKVFFDNTEYIIFPQLITRHGC